MSLRQAALAGGRWTAASTAFSFGLQILQVMVLARLLEPADFGVMAVAAALISIVTLFADFGLTRALIHFDLPSREALATLYWLNLALAVAFCVVFMALAPLIGATYRTPELVPVLRWAGLVLPLTALGQQFRVLAEKELRFDRVVRNDMVANVTGFCVAVTAALGGAGVYALVAGMLTAGATNSGLAWLLLSRGRRPALRCRPAEVTAHLRFGRYMIGGDLTGVLNRQADMFVGGLVLGARSMGLFALPRDLCLGAGMVINQVMTRVGFPVMAQVKDDRDRLRGIYVRTLRMTAPVNFPVFIGLALFADEVVAVLYGSRWDGAAQYLEILALWGLVRSVGQPVGALLNAVGHVRAALAWNVAQLVLVPAIYVVALNAGDLHALALAMLAAQLLLFLPLWRLLVWPACGLSLAEYLRALAVPLVLAAVAGALARAAAMPFDSSFGRLCAGVVVGASGYLAFSLWFNRAWMDAVRELLHLPPASRAR